MHDSAGTSDSAASSDGSSSPLGLSDDSQARDAVEGTQGLRVDFYILDESSAAARLKLACRLAEKAYLAAQTALVWHTDAEELKAFDDLLWTFMDGSFVPHEMLTASASSDDTPTVFPRRSSKLLIDFPATKENGSRLTLPPTISSEPPASLSSTTCSVMP